MYFIPQPYKCQKCETVFKWSLHHDPLGFGEPFCIKCFLKFIKTNVSQGIRVEEKRDVI
jgi:hypothetical protein